MTLRHQFTALLLIFSVLVGGRLSWDAWQSQVMADEAAQAAFLHARAAELLAARQALAAERGLSAGIASAPARATPAQWEAMRARRAEAAAAFAAALPALGNQPGLEQARRAGAAARERLESPSGIPPAEHFAALTQEIDALTAVRRLIDARAGQSSTRSHDPVADLTDLRDALAMLAEFIGRERGTINGLLTRGTPPSTAEWRMLGEFRGQADAATTRAATRLNLIDHEPVSRAVRAADALQAGEFGALRRGVLAALDAGGRPAVTPADWFAAATRVIDLLGEAQSATTRAILEHAAERQASLRQGLILAVGVLLAGLVTLLAVSWHMRRALFRPLAAIMDRVVAMQQGELTAPVPGQRVGHEMGALARAVEAFRLSLMSAAEERIKAEHDRQRADAAHVSALRGMADEVEAETRSGIEQMAQQFALVVEGAGGVSSASARALGESRAATSAASEAQDSANAVAAATEELGASIQHINARLAAASEATRKAATLGDSGRERIGALSEAVSRIGGVVTLIGTIAEQTNLLALNATIEAARSGEAGRGFAVVASAVKALATETARATAEISREIGAVMESTEGTVTLVRAMADQVAEVDEVTAAISAALAQQSEATREIATAVARAAVASGRVNDSMGGVSAAATASNDQAERMRASSVTAQVAIDATREKIVRVLRQSVQETNRRQMPRLPINISGALRIPGQSASQEARLIDISEGGFRIEPCPGLAYGMRVAVTLPALVPGLELPAEVLESASGGARCRFIDPPAALAQALAGRMAA